MSTMVQSGTGRLLMFVTDKKRYFNGETFSSHDFATARASGQEF